MARRLRIGWPRQYTAVMNPGAYSHAGQAVGLSYQPAADTTPNQFTFTDQTGVATSTAITSAAITISGLSVGTSITLNASGGTIDKNSDANFLGSQIVQNGDMVRARVTSSSLNSTAVNCTVAASPSGVQDVFTATTVAASSGAVDGSLRTISGTGFGTATPTSKLWTGGNASALLGLADDADYTGVWDSRLSMPPFLTDGTHRNRWRADTGRSYSRGKSIIWDATNPNNITGGNQGEGTAVFSPGLTSLGSCYLRMLYYYRIGTGITYLQNKFFRLISQYTAEGGASGVSDGEGNNILISDANGDGVYAVHTGATYPPFGAQASYFVDAGWGSSGSVALGQRNGWYEIQLEFVDSSTLSSSDGLLRVTTRRTTDFAQVQDAPRNNIPIYAGSGTRLKYLTIQWGLYNGDDFGSPGPVHGNASINFCDLFIVTGTRGRVFLGNASTFAACTQFEMCDYSSWANTSIDVVVNQGAFANLSGKYWYVYNSNTGALVSTTGQLLT